MRRLFIYFAIAGLLCSVAFAEDVAPAMQRGSLAPAVPGKVVRYAQVFMQRYDTNGDGILQRDEWAKMPGTPQAIDIDGDGQVTMEELLWYFAHYAQSRTIHHTFSVNLADPYRFDAASMSLFRPIVPRAAAPQAAEADTQEPAGDLTEDMLKANEQLMDDEAYEKMLEERQIPSNRPFYTSPENLRGVPRWFIEADKNGDGQVSLREFAPTFSPVSVDLFKRYDKNGDGYIVPDEVRVSQPTGSALPSTTP